jgi:hypothetical protein
MSDEFWTMKEIGQVFGLSSHVIGRKLKELGLRTAAGKPSRSAFRDGYCDQRWDADLTNYCWAWAKTKTISALEGCGLTRGMGCTR